ncbi:hypothetical protein JHK87_003376 [Glycine soja]|nr:hypothetical protein JHK87_003376 [Glycine soja]
MLGEESEDDDQKGLDSTESNDDQDEEEELMQIKDETETNLVNLRKTIYSAIYNMPRLIMQQQKHESRNSNSPDYRTASSDSEPDLACSDESDRRRRKRRRKCKAI